MILKIPDNYLDDFVASIIDYIMETYCILPRNFNVVINDQMKVPLYFDHKQDKLCISECEQFNKHDTHLHLHKTPFMYCTHPEILAAKFICTSVHEPRNIRIKLLATLKEWLPNVTWQYTKIGITHRDVNIAKGKVYTDLFPAYARNLMYKLNLSNRTTQNLSLVNFIFYYYRYHNVYDEKTDNADTVDVKIATKEIIEDYSYFLVIDDELREDPLKVIQNQDTTVVKQASEFKLIKSVPSITHKNFKLMQDRNETPCMIRHFTKLVKIEII